MAAPGVSVFIDAQTKGYEDALKRAASETDKLSKSFTRAEQEMSKSSGRFANSATNVAQQVQDMAVQWQQGTAAATIFAQQLPQLASGFGAVGAAVGAAVAVTAVIASKFFDLNSTIKETPDYLGNMSDAMSDVSKSAKQLLEDINNATSSTLNLMAAAAQLRQQGVAEEASKLAGSVTGVFESRAAEALKAAQPPSGALNVPFAGTRQALDVRTAPQILAARETGRNVRGEIEKAIAAGDTEALRRIIDRDKLYTAENEANVNRLIEAAKSVELAKATEKAIAEAKAARDRSAGKSANAPPPSDRTGGGTRSLGQLAGDGGKTSRADSFREEARIVAEENQKIAAAYRESIAEGKRVEQSIEAQRKVRAAGIRTMDDEAKKLVQLQIENQRLLESADNSKIIHNLTAERDARAALLKDANKVTNASKEQEAAMEAVNALRKSGIDLTTVEGQEIERLAKQNAILNVRLDEQQKLEGQSDKGSAKREKKIEAVDFEIQMTQKLIDAVRTSDQAYADALVEVDALRAAHALGAEATEAERQAVYNNAKEREKANAILKQELALRQAVLDRQQLIASGELTPIRRDAAGQALPNTPPVKPAVVDTKAIDEALGLGENAKDHASQYTDAWKSALEDLQGVFTDTFEQLFSGQLDSAKNFAEQLKKIISRGMANMLSGALFSGGGIGGLLGGGAGGLAGGGASSLLGMLGGARPLGDYRTMTQADAMARMGMGPLSRQSPWMAPGVQPMSWAAMRPGLMGLGAMGLAGIGGMLGGVPGQLGLGGIMSTLGTGAMLGHGLGATYGVGGGSMLLGSLAGRFAGGGAMGAGMGALSGAALGFFSGGGPVGALAGGLLGGFGGFLGGGGRAPRNRAAFSFNPLTGSSSQDSSPGRGDPNREAAVQLSKELQQLTAALRGFGVNFKPGTIRSSVSRTQSADEALASILKQLRGLAVGGSVPVQKAIKNSQATTPEGLIEDVKFAQEFEVMIRLITPFQAKMRELNAQFAQAAVKARELGLNEDALSKARERARAELFAQREVEANALRAQLGIIGPFDARMRELTEAFRQAGLRAEELGINVENLAAAQKRAMEDLAQERENAANNLRAQLGIISPEEANVRQIDANVYWGARSAADLGIDPNEIRQAGERQKQEMRRQSREEGKARRDAEVERKRQLRMEAVAIREQLGIINQWDAALAQLNETIADAKRRTDELGLSESELNAARRRAEKEILRSRIEEADAVKVRLGVFSEYDAVHRDIENAYADAKAHLKDYWLTQKEIDDARTRSYADLEQRRKSEAAAIRGQLGIISTYQAQMAELEEAFYQAGRLAKDLKLTESELSAARTRAIADLQHQRQVEADQLRAQTGVIGPMEAQRREIEEMFYQAGKQAKDLGVSESELAAARARALANLQHQRDAEATQLRSQLGIVGPWAAQLAELEEAFYQARQSAADLGISEGELTVARTRALADLARSRQNEADQLRAQTGLIGNFEYQFRQLEDVFAQAIRDAAELGISESDLQAARTRAMEDLRQQRIAEANAIRGQLGIIGEYEAAFRELEETFRQVRLQASDLGISEAELSAARDKALNNLRQQRIAEAQAIRGQLGITGPFESQMRALEETFRQASLRAADLGISEGELAAARARAIADLQHQRQVERDSILAQTGIISPFEAQMRQLEEMFYQASRRASDLGISENELNKARLKAIDNLKKQRDEQLRQIEDQLRSGGEQLRGFVDSLVNPLKQALSPQGIYAGILAPQAAANDNMLQFREVLKQARADDVTAIQNLPAVAQAAVEAARAYGGSGAQFEKMFKEVEAGLKEVLGVQIDRQQAIVNETPEAIRRSAQQQIDVMREEFARLRDQMEGLRRDLRLKVAA